MKPSTSNRGGTEPKQTGSSTPAASAETLSLRQILVPVDFSAPSAKALAYAVAFARQFKAEVTVLHVVPDVASGTRLAISTPELQKALTREGRENLDKEVARFHGGPVQIKSLLKAGIAHKEITDCARAMAADLIIVATHGYTGLKHVVLGSTTERIVRHAPCPVLVLRDKEHEFVAV